MHTSSLTQKEIDERVAILKRFKHLLEEKRQKFREYLKVLEKQETAIQSDDVEAIVQHTEIEQAVLAEISTIQKVIEPMEAMYRATHPNEPDSSVPVLKTDLDLLQKQVLEQNNKNREILKTHMNVLREKITTLKNPYAKQKSIYASDAHTATHIDINQ